MIDFFLRFKELSFKVHLLPVVLLPRILMLIQPLLQLLVLLLELIQMFVELGGQMLLLQEATVDVMLAFQCGSV